MTFRTTFRLAFALSLSLGLLVSAHASYSLFFSLNGDYPGHIMPPRQQGRPGQPAQQQQTLFPCTSFTFLAPPLRLGGPQQKVPFIDSATTDLSKLKLPTGANQVLVYRVRDSYSSQFADGCRTKTVYGMCALSYQGKGSNASVPIRAFTMQMVHITAMTRYSRANLGRPPTPMEELTLTFERLDDTAAPAP
jgi:hypothetical protein